MSKVLVTEQYLTDIANAIRTKNNLQTTYKPNEMATAIQNLPSGGGVNINNQDKTVTPSATQQIITADSGYTGLGNVTILGDNNLISNNIADGISIFGVTGSLKFVTCYSGAGAPDNSQGNDGDIYLRTE